MSIANPNIYGQLENYTNAYHILNRLPTPTEETYREQFGAEIPKNGDFGGTKDGAQGCLLRAIEQNKLSMSAPIDSSISALGQGKEISPYSNIDVWQVIHDTPQGEPQIKSEKISSRENNTSIFYFSYQSENEATNNNLCTQYGSDNDSLLRWSPDGVLRNSDDEIANPNASIYPFVSYGAKSMMLHIWVGFYINQSNPTLGLTWARLYEWKNTYSQYPISAIMFEISMVSSISSSDITYTSTSQNTNDYATYERVSAACCDSYDNIYQYTVNICDTNIVSRPKAGIFILQPFSYNNDTYWVRSDRRIYFPTYGQFADESMKKYYSRLSYGGDRIYIYKSIPYSIDNYNKIMSICASYGLPFTDKNVYTFSTNFDSEDLYFPIIDDNGITHGEYTHGSANITNAFNDLKDVREKNYVPSENTDTNTYSNITGFNSISAGASATERYVLDAGNTRQLLSDLWVISHDIAGADYENYDYKILDSFLVSNPIDCIISLKRFPFSIPHTFSIAKTAVNLGKNHGSAKGYLTYNVFNTVQFAGINIFPRFGNSFLDYAPYTEYELYIPFCGTVKLNAGDILGHTLNCRLQIDLITGACTAYIMADSLVIETMTGTVSCELALTGIDSATIDANIQNSVLNHVNARTNKETSMLSPLSIGGLGSAALNPFKTAGNITTAKTELQRAEYELTHIQTQPHTMGTAGGLTGWYQEFNARLMIYYPEGDVITSAQPPTLKNLASYGHTTGFATIDNTALSNYSGFTVATNAILDFAATTTEKDMIESALNGGIFI